MSTLSNSPSALTLLRLEARKSFSLGLYFRDSNHRPLDITGAELTFTLGKQARRQSPDSVLVTKTAALAVPTAGLARLDLQAADLDLTPGTYAFDVVMVSEGYSGVVVKGEVELIDNTSFGLTDYPDGSDTLELVTLTLQQQTLTLEVGPTLPRDLLHVPFGGEQGWILAKASDDSYDLTWWEIPQATSDTRGILQFATTEQAVAGAETLYAMSPATVLAAMQAYISPDVIQAAVGPFIDTHIQSALGPSVTAAAQAAAAAAVGDIIAGTDLSATAIAGAINAAGGPAQLAVDARVTALAPGLVDAELAAKGLPATGVALATLLHNTFDATIADKIDPTELAAALAAALGQTADGRPIPETVTATWTSGKVTKLVTKRGATTVSTIDIAYDAGTGLATTLTETTAAGVHVETIARNGDSTLSTLTGSNV